jgi:hypothetical protein
MCNQCSSLTHHRCLREREVRVDEGDTYADGLPAVRYTTERWCAACVREEGDRVPSPSAMPDEDE